MGDFCDIRMSTSRDENGTTYSLEIETTNQDEFERVKNAVDDALNRRMRKTSIEDCMVDDGK